MAVTFDNIGNGKSLNINNNGYTNFLAQLNKTDEGMNEVFKTYSDIADNNYANQVKQKTGSIMGALQSGQLASLEGIDLSNTDATALADFMEKKEATDAAELHQSNMLSENIRGNKSAEVAAALAATRGNEARLAQDLHNTAVLEQKDDASFLAQEKLWFEQDKYDAEQLRIKKADELKYNIDAGTTEADNIYESGMYGGLTIKGKDKNLLSTINKELATAQAAGDDRTIAKLTQLTKLIKTDVKGGKQITDLALIKENMNSTVPKTSNDALAAADRFLAKPENKNLLDGYDKAQTATTMKKINKEAISLLRGQEGVWNKIGNELNLAGSGASAIFGVVSGKDNTQNERETTISVIESAIDNLGTSAKEEELKEKLLALKRKAYKLNPYEKGTKAYKKKRINEVTNLVQSRADSKALLGI